MFLILPSQVLISFSYNQIECEFLSNSATKPHLPDLLQQILVNLNTNGECVIEKIGTLQHSSLFLKLIEKHIDPHDVQSLDVPVFIIDLSNFQFDEWDLATHKVSSP
jgi:hypothetical protein